MRVECDHCHTVSEAELAIAGEAVEMTCSACGRTSRTPVRVNDPYRGGAPEEAAPADACPKCGTSPVGEHACPRCGLAVDRMAAWAADDAAAAAPDATLDEAWAACHEAWSDDERHDRAAALAHQHHAYAWLARRYRAVLRDRPGDPVATARLARLSSIVAVTMTAGASPARAAPARRTSLVAVVLLLALIVGAGVLAARLIVKSESGARRTPATPASKGDARMAPASHRAPPPPSPHAVEPDSRSLPQRTIETGP